MWGCFVPKGHQPCADLSVSVTHQHLPEGSHPVTRVFSGLQSPFPSPMCFGSVGVSADSSVSHGVVTAGRASRLSPPHRKALIPLCSQPVQHLSHPHREPLQSQPFPGFRASLPPLWGCVGFLWCHCVLSLCPQASLVPQLPCLGLGTLLPCGSVAPGVCLVAWGPSLPFSPLASSFPLCSPFLVNPRAPVVQEASPVAPGACGVPTKDLWGRSKVCHSVSVTGASSSCAGKDTGARQAQLIPWRCLPASQCHRHSGALSSCPEGPSLKFWKEPDPAEGFSFVF